MKNKNQEATGAQLRNIRLENIIGDLRSLSRELERAARDVEEGGLNASVPHLLIGYAHRLSQSAVAAAGQVGP